MSKGKSTPKKRMTDVHYYAAKALARTKGKSLESLLAEKGLSFPNSAEYRLRTCELALSIEPPKSFLFPDGNGGLREEKVPADFPQPMLDAVKKAFKHYNLDPADPFSWRILVEYFAYIFFWKPPTKKVGRAKTWTPEVWAELAKSVASLPGLSNIEAARRLANDKSSKFYQTGIDADAGVRGLRDRIGKLKKKSNVN